jgi:hypothetical protein
MCLLETNEVSELLNFPLVYITGFNQDSVLEYRNAYDFTIQVRLEP